MSGLKNGSAKNVFKHEWSENRSAKNVLKNEWSQNGSAKHVPKKEWSQKKFSFNLFFENGTSPGILDKAKPRHTLVIKSED